MTGPEVLVPLGFFAMVSFIVVGLPMAKAIAKKAENESKGVPNEVAARLERMEQAIDSIAIEVERIAEGQRFTTRLLADRAGERAPAIAAPNDMER